MVEMVGMVSECESCNIICTLGSQHIPSLLVILGMFWGCSISDLMLIVQVLVKKCQTLTSRLVDGADDGGLLLYSQARTCGVRQKLPLHLVFLFFVM